ncbi:glycosyltransferase [Winogradskyella psychrotolerans]|uniref:glycosyltransferase family 2 protein n=1 Tax=Winogradskyella psychrotolerans TaxID=1344585 RepID=UPI001C070F37|nr:glycosyltransferase [Winogradskyella psychrotolerans]MBU2919813.1 glycosyltransferase [Winogradskyella psychrotolerans]
MMVSVCMITYGHEKYIKEAIEGVLMQECNFDVELIIADDCSPDSTHKIIADIQQKHINGSWIKYTKHTANKGMMPNFIWALDQCQSKYIALCEGDDYWTDSSKLQKQVDFLEANLDYSICFHRVKILRGTELFDDTSIEFRYNKIQEMPATINNLLEFGNFIHTTSVVFRNRKFEFPMEFKYSSVGDYFLHLINAKYGFIKRLDIVMAVYREGVGVFSTLNDIEQLKQIIKYQICLVSYFKENEQKRIILEKLFFNIERLNNSHLNHHSLAKRLSFKKIIKIFITKLFKYRND